MVSGRSRGLCLGGYRLVMLVEARKAAFDVRAIHAGDEAHAAGPRGDMPTFEQAAMATLDLSATHPPLR